MRVAGSVRQDDDVHAAVLRRVGFGAALFGLGRALGEGIQALRIDSEEFEIFLYGVGAMVTEAEIVFSRAAPVAIADQHEFLVGIVLEPLGGGLGLWALGGGDGEAVEGKIDRFHDTLVVLGWGADIVAGGKIGRRVAVDGDLGGVDATVVIAHLGGVRSGGAHGLLGAGREKEGGNGERQAEEFGAMLHDGR